MKLYRPFLDWIDTQETFMVKRLQKWCQTNTHTFNIPGLKSFSKELAQSFRVLGGHLKFVSLPPCGNIDSSGRYVDIPLAKGIYLRKRSSVKKQVFLCCHMDTVYSPEGHPSIVRAQKKRHILKGQGAADAKGGIMVMLKALEAFERSPFKERLGWMVFVNPDEEIGSVGSKIFFKKMAQRCKVGLVFEPCLPNGNLIGQRKGSGNFTLVVHGRSAHAGRDFYLGRNAITALAECITAMDRLNNIHRGVTLNMGKIQGGEAVNVVADLAILRFNIRLNQRQEENFILKEIRRVINRVSRDKEVKIELRGQFSASPKVLDVPTTKLLKDIQKCAGDLRFPLNWESSGGVCDGNRLASLGLPTVDTMGVRGGAIHSPQEYIHTDSLVERAKLTALFLMKLANEDL